MSSLCSNGLPNRGCRASHHTSCTDCLKLYRPLNPILTINLPQITAQFLLATRTVKVTATPPPLPILRQCALHYRCREACLSICSVKCLKLIWM